MEKLFCPLCEREYEPGIKFCPQDASELIFRSEDTMTGQVFDGRYRILHKLGEGGMGAVYKAVQISTQKPVAIKVVAARHTENPATVRRFQREVKLQSRLEHPNIVTVIDFAKTPEGQYFFVMPFIEGKSLRRMILDGGKFSLADFLALATQLCDGLEYAHREGIVHRDIKGDNIVVAELGHQRVAKILDFGLAKAIQQDGETTKSGPELTSEGLALGTPAYMSPEQAKGQVDKIGPHSDLYSLGVIFYQMLTGALPFKSDTPWGLLHQHISEPPVPVRQINPDVPESIERAVMRLLEKEPEKRYPSALALRRDLETAARASAGRADAAPEETPTAMPSGFVKTMEGEPTPRSRSRVAALLALLIAVVGVGIWLYGRGGGAPEPPAPVALVKPERPAAPVAPPAPVVEKKAEPETRRPEVTPPPQDASTQAEKEKREKVESLLAAAKKDFAANRLTGPKGKNALEKYQATLAIDPANAPAKGGLEKIAARNVELAQAAIDKEEAEKAEEYLVQAETAQPGYLPAVKARAKFAALKTEKERKIAEREHQRAEEQKRQEDARLAREERERNAELASENIGMARQNLSSRNLMKAEEFIAKAEGLAPDLPEVKRLRVVLEEKKKVPEDMVFVKGGCFEMGDTFGYGESGERPVHRVCVDNFWMDKYEVMQEAFQRVMGKNLSYHESCPGCPVEVVIWDEAKEYCGKVGKRLPTEAEWEYAAREGGKKVKYGTGRNELSQNDANYNSNGTKPVGSYAPNALGLYDMAGNVGEWVADRYGEDYYRQSPESNPKGPSGGQFRARVVRGGSWASSSRNQRTAFRDGFLPDYRHADCGFRCAQ